MAITLWNQYIYIVKKTLYFWQHYLSIRAEKRTDHHQQQFSSVHSNTQRANINVSISLSLHLDHHQSFSLNCTPPALQPSPASTALASFVRKNNTDVERLRRQDCCDGQNENRLILPKLMDAVFLAVWIILMRVNRRFWWGLLRSHTFVGRNTH